MLTSPIREDSVAEDSKMDRNLALEAVRVTELAALSASRLMGRGDEKAADQAAVDAMRQALNSLNIDGTVVIGEGERDEAPMLYIGEKVGTGQGPQIDIALDPLEGTTITAKRGAPEGVLAAAASRCIGGQMHGRRLCRNDDERGRAQRLGITDLNRKYGLLGLAHGDVMFAATGVTNGSMLKGVGRFGSGAFTHSVVMRSKTGTVRYVEATHDFTRKQPFAPLGR